MAFCIEDNVLKEYIREADEEVVKIPDGVTQIGGGIFNTVITNGCFGIKEFIIPNSVVCISSSAFAGATIENVVIPESVKCIEFNAFGGCVNLKHITVLSKDVRIDTGAFFGCSNLELLTIPYSVAVVSDQIFKTSTKMVTTELIDCGEQPIVVMGLWRKDYYSQSFSFKKDCLFPIEKEFTEIYDKVLAAGAYEGFNTNENGRIKGMIWRASDKTNPVDTECRKMFGEFLATKLTKAIKFAAEGDVRTNIAALISLKIITTENEKKVKKALEKVNSDEAIDVASKLHSLIESVADDATEDVAGVIDEKTNVLTPEFQKLYKRINAKSVLMKNGITEIPAVKLADHSGDAPAEYLELIIAAYLKRDSIPGLINETADMLDETEFKSALLTIYDGLTNIKHKTGFMAPLFRYIDGNDMVKIYRDNVFKWNEQELLSYVLLNDSREAMLLAEKNHKLMQYASMRGLKEDVLRDRYLSDIGLDENGRKEYDLGNGVVSVELQNDLSFVVFVPGKKKSSKSLPKKNADLEMYATANADFAQMKKDAKKIIRSRSEKLFEDYLSGKARDFSDWRAAFIENALLRKLANIIVWTQNNTSFILKDKTPVLANGREYIFDEQATVKVAHPIEMDDSETSDWQEYFRKNNLKQPFDQVWEPVTKPETITPDRYKNTTIFWRRPQNAEKHGIHFYDNEFHNDVGFTLEDCSLGNWITSPMRHFIAEDATFTLGEFSYKEYTRKVNHIVYILDKWTIWDRIRKDDISVMDIIDNYTVAQITEFISIASEAQASNVTAALLAYKRNRFPDYDAFLEFTLDSGI